MKKVKNMTEFIKEASKGEMVAIDAEALNQDYSIELSDFEDQKEEAKKYGNVDWIGNAGGKETIRGQPVYAYSNFCPTQLEKSTEVGTLFFIIDAGEKAAYNKFVKTHKCEYIGNAFRAGAFGSNFSFIFRPNTVGQTAIVKCNCGEECDLTDYDMW